MVVVRRDVVGFDARWSIETRRRMFQVMVVVRRDVVGFDARWSIETRRRMMFRGMFDVGDVVDTFERVDRRLMRRSASSIDASAHKSQQVDSGRVSTRPRLTVGWWTSYYDVRRCERVGRTKEHVHRTCPQHVRGCGYDLMRPLAV